MRDLLRKSICGTIANQQASDEPANKMTRELIVPVQEWKGRVKERRISAQGVDDVIA